MTKPKPERVPLKLIKQWTSNNPGETIAVAPHVATKLIDQGFAKLLNEPEPEREPAEVGDEPAESGEGAQPAAAAPKKTAKKST